MRTAKQVACYVLAVIIAANLILTIVSFRSEGKSLMDVQDSLNWRLVQMVNATATVEPSAGTGATASVDGNDAIGQINITTGASPSAGSLMHVTFHTPYRVQPFGAIIPMDQPPPVKWYYTIDTDGFDIWVGAAPAPHTNYPFSYFLGARPWLMYLNGPAS